MSLPQHTDASAVVQTEPLPQPNWISLALTPGWSHWACYRAPPGQAVTEYLMCRPIVLDGAGWTDISTTEPVVMAPPHHDVVVGAAVGTGAFVLLAVAVAILARRKPALRLLPSRGKQAT